jgi:GDP-L-fucose synthase
MSSPLTPPLADPAYWRGKRVLVTGGSGFIGSHLVERLRPLCGALVVPTRREGVPPFLRAVARDVEIVRGDLRDEAVAGAACRGADVAILLAAVVGGIEYNQAHHASIFRDNLGVFLETMEAARRATVGRVLVVSSACVYPRACSIPTPESEGFVDRPEPTNEGYGWSKRMEEFLGAAYGREFGMSIAVARPYNAYGPRDNFDPASSHVIPALIRKAFDPASDVLEVWGSGRQSRSFLYVLDFVDGLLRICERAGDAAPTNLGAAEETSIGDAARIIAALAGTGKRIAFDTGRPEGQPRRRCDTGRLERLFDFRARVALRDGLAATVEYFRSEVLPAAGAAAPRR